MKHKSCHGRTRKYTETEPDAGATVSFCLTVANALCLFCIFAFKPSPLRWVGLLNNPHRKKKTHAAQCMGFKTNPMNITYSSLASWL
jgi:hypothetical protein